MVGDNNFCGREDDNAGGNINFRVGDFRFNVGDFNFQVGDVTFKDGNRNRDDSDNDGIFIASHSSFWLAECLFRMDNNRNRND